MLSWYMVPLGVGLQLGDAGDWATAVGLGLGCVGLVAAVWKLARAATRLESAVTTLMVQQQTIANQYQQQWEAFCSFQRDTNAAIHELQLAVSKLTWEVSRGPHGSGR